MDFIREFMREPFNEDLDYINPFPIIKERINHLEQRLKKYEELEPGDENIDPDDEKIKLKLKEKLEKVKKFLDYLVEQETTYQEYKARGPTYLKNKQQRESNRDYAERKGRNQQQAKSIHNAMLLSNKDYAERFGRNQEQAKKEQDIKNQNEIESRRGQTIGRGGRKSRKKPRRNRSRRVRR